MYAIHPTRAAIVGEAFRARTNTPVLKVPETTTRVRRRLLAMLVLSCVPYLLPYEMQPKVYHDGLTEEQRRERAAYRALQRQMGGARFGDVGEFFLEE